MFKKLAALAVALMLLMTSTALADTVIDTIMNAGTTQAFTDEAVAREDLEAILRAGLSAASAINQQPWFFVAITNPDLVAEITGTGAAAAPAAEAPAAEGDSSGAPAGESDGDSSGAPAGDSNGDSSGAPAGDSNGDSSGAPAGDSAGAPAAAASGAKAGFGDSPLAIIIYRNDSSMSPNADFDCGLAAQNMVIAAAALGYGVKIVSSPTGTLNGANHNAICEKLGVDPSLQAVAVLLIGRPDLDATSTATTRDDLNVKTVILE